MSTTIRRAGPDDVDRVGELTAHAYLADDLLSHDDDYLHELRDAASRVDAATVLVAADEDGAIVGTITLAVAGSPYAEIAEADEVELRMLAVDPAARGRGVGEALLRHALAHARAAGSPVILSTMPAMHTAQRMYDRLGLHRLPGRDWPVADQVMLVYGTARPGA